MHGVCEEHLKGRGMKKKERGERNKQNEEENGKRFV